MAFRDVKWQCDNCFNPLIPGEAASDIDEVLVEEDLTMADVMRQYEDKNRGR
jgi:hypothetical protein